MVVVLPGDRVRDAGESYAAIKLGPGLLPSEDAAPTSSSLSAIKSGALGHVETRRRVRGGKGTEPSSTTVDGWWVESDGHRVRARDMCALIAVRTRTG